MHSPSPIYCILAYFHPSCLTPFFFYSWKLREDKKISSEWTNFFSLAILNYCVRQTLFVSLFFCNFQLTPTFASTSSSSLVNPHAVFPVISDSQGCGSANLYGSNFISRCGYLLKTNVNIGITSICDNEGLLPSPKQNFQRNKKYTKFYDFGFKTTNSCTISTIH